MTNPKRTGSWLIGLAVFLIIAAVFTAGCLDSASDQDSQMTTVGAEQTGQPAVTAAVQATKTTEPVKTVSYGSTQTPSVTIVTLDPIRNTKSGDLLLITGTTWLPSGTNLIWQIMPDTGTTPTGLDKTATMSIMASSYVAKGNATWNLASVTMETKRLKPGKYVALVAEMEDDPATGTADIGRLAGYTWFTLT